MVAEIIIRVHSSVMKSGVWISVDWVSHTAGQSLIKHSDGVTLQQDYKITAEMVIMIILPG